MDKLRKWRRKKRKSWDYRINDPCDGLEIHRIVQGSYHASKQTFKISQFDSDSAFIEMNGNRWAKRVSVMGYVRKINRYRTTRINSYKEKLNRKA